MLCLTLCTFAFRLSLSPPSLFLSPSPSLSLQGVAPFGYGMGTEATETLYGSRHDNKRTTTYFRKTFYLDGDRAAIIRASRVAARVLFAHGVIIYVNGVEAWRGNLIDGEIVYLKKAMSTRTLPDTATYTPTDAFDGSLFVEGYNLVRFPVASFQLSAVSCQLSLSLSLSLSPPGSPLHLAVFATDCCGGAFGDSPVRRNAV